MYRTAFISVAFLLLNINWCYCKNEDKYSKADSKPTVDPQHKNENIRYKRQSSPFDKRGFLWSHADHPYNDMYFGHTAKTPTIFDIMLRKLSEPEYLRPFLKYRNSDEIQHRVSNDDFINNINTRANEEIAPQWPSRGKKMDKNFLTKVSSRRDEDPELLRVPADRRNDDRDVFWGNRGKREEEPFWDKKGKKDEEPFWGNRGKRTEEEEQFWGNRGRRSGNEDEQFWGNRGRRSDNDDEHFWGNRGRRSDNEKEQFWGNRGRRGDTDDEHFWGNRGKRSDTLEEQFWGNRGKKSDNVEEQFWGNRGRRSGIPHQYLKHTFPHQYTNLEDYFKTLSVSDNSYTENVDDIPSSINSKRLNHKIDLTSLKTRRGEDDDQFWGSRGKRNNEMLNYDQQENNRKHLYKGKEPENGNGVFFWRLRGKRDDDDPFWGNRGKRDDVLTELFKNQEDKADNREWNHLLNSLKQKIALDIPSIPKYSPDHTNIDLSHHGKDNFYDHLNRLFLRYNLRNMSPDSSIKNHLSLLALGDALLNQNSSHSKNGDELIKPEKYISLNALPSANDGIVIYRGDNKDSHREKRDLGSFIRGVMNTYVKGQSVNKNAEKDIKTTKETITTETKKSSDDTIKKNKLKNVIKRNADSNINDGQVSIEKLKSISLTPDKFPEIFGEVADLRVEFIEPSLVNADFENNEAGQIHSF